MEQESECLTPFQPVFVHPALMKVAMKSLYWLELYGQQCYSLMVDITIKESLEDRAFEGIFEYCSPPMTFGSPKTMSFNSRRLGGEKKRISSPAISHST